MGIIFKPDYNLDLGIKMSLADAALTEAKSIVKDHNQHDESIRRVALQLLQSQVEKLYSFAERQEPSFLRFFRKLLKVFGIVTQYQRVINQVEEMGSTASLMEEREKCLCAIVKELPRLSERLDLVEKAVVAFRDKTGNDWEHAALVNFHLDSFDEMKKPIDHLAEIYQGDIPEFHDISKLVDRFNAAAKELEEFAGKLALLNGVSELDSVGGIKNGGNTCYLASALQVMNQIEVYRNLFHPELNPLKKKHAESEDSFTRREQIQLLGRNIINKVRDGTTVSRNEINDFRQVCYAQGVVDIEYGQTDALRTLEALFAALGFREDLLMVESTYEIDPEVYEQLDNTHRNPLEYSDFTPRLSKQRETSLVLNAFNYAGSTIGMEALISRFYAETTLDDGLIMKVPGEQEGEFTYRKYHSVRCSKTLAINNDNPPPVLRVVATQGDGRNKVLIKNPEIIYPSGTLGMGPAYRLKAIIEHRPGHYVAHLVGPNGRLVEANDSWVHPIDSSTLPGQAYFYELIKD